MKASFIISLLSIFLTTACANQRAGLEQVKVAKCIELTVPSGLVLSEQSPVGDFVLAQFTKDNKPVLTVYVGSNPQFPGRYALPPKKKAEIQGFAVQESIGKPDTPCYKEFLVDFGPDLYWPRYAHFTILRGSGQEQVELENAIQSLHFVSGPGVMRKSDFKDNKGK